jgi:hypothetical protein
MIAMDPIVTKQSPDVKENTQSWQKYATGPLSPSLKTRFHSRQYYFDGGASPNSVMNALRDAGSAAEFESLSSWRQDMTVILKIVGGELIVDSVEWADIN